MLDMDFQVPEALERRGRGRQNRRVASIGERTYAPQVVRPFWKLLREYPQVPAEVLDQLERAEPQRVPVTAAQEQLRALVALTGDPDLGLRAARTLGLGDYEVLEYVTMSASTWREAIETLLRYTRIMNEAADFALEVVGQHAHVVFRSRLPLARAGVDYQSAAYHVVASHWLTPAVELEAWFVHPEPEDLSQYHETFPNVRLRFGAPWDGFRFEAWRLDTPLQTHDPSLHRVLREHAEQLLTTLAPGDSLVEHVRAHVLETLKTSAPSAEATAAKLHMTRRTLTRRLRQEGTTFTDLVEEVRRHTAAHYLQTTDYSVEDIAFLVGFSGASPFVRAFKRWTGKSPLVYRKAYREA